MPHSTSRAVRPEYPRPQFRRDDWRSLNGEWEFSFDDADRGEELGWPGGGVSLGQRIIVPFAYQSRLSGLADPELHDIVWYRRTFHIPPAWAGQRVLLHFGAVDYAATVWVNGSLAGSHRGGHTPFAMDITRLLGEQNVVVVRAQDPSRDVTLPRGKQYWEDEPRSIFYTATTGIWQTVWLEPVPRTSINAVRFTPDIDNSSVGVSLDFSGSDTDQSLRVRCTIRYSGISRDSDCPGEIVAEDTFSVTHTTEHRAVGLPNFYHDGYTRWWTPENPNLYGVTLLLERDGVEVDRIESYFGMRKISIEKGNICLNNRPYYMRLVLDQGYFPDGGLTAPTDEDLEQDIRLAKQMGFNGARKHQKVEDPRWLYWCDTLGFLVWGEMANAYAYSDEYVREVVPEWLDVIERDYNHPCIVVWVPLNESWGVPNIQVDSRQQSHSRSLYYLTKSVDSTRLVMSNDGWEHTTSDICSIHDYDPDGASLALRYRSKEDALGFLPAHRQIFAGDAEYGGEPIMVTEFGGISVGDDTDGWGYSSARDGEQFLGQLRELFSALTKSPVVQGICYTQLTDVEREVNGLLTYEREPKADLVAIRSIVTGRGGSGE